MAHSFLLREGRWRASGEYRDAAGVATAAEGETRIRHEAGRWLSEGVMRLKRNPPEEQRHRYDIAPLSPGAQSTHWSAENDVGPTSRPCARRSRKRCSRQPIPTRSEAALRRFAAICSRRSG